MEGFFNSTGGVVIFSVLVHGSWSSHAGYKFFCGEDGYLFADCDDGAKQLPTLAGVYSGAVSNILTSVVSKLLTIMDFVSPLTSQEEAVNFSSDGDIVSLQDIAPVLQEPEEK